MMLCHISLRITDKLKSAYPQAVWQWKQKPSLKDILAGATLRIAVDDMEKYNHADICFDRFGRIHVQPLASGVFNLPRRTLLQNRRMKSLKCLPS